LLTGVATRSRDLVPFAAQIIGGTMTATTLAALRMRDDVLATGTVEAPWRSAPHRSGDHLARSSAARR
jgi:hypothetical protein